MGVSSRARSDNTRLKVQHASERPQAAIVSQYNKRTEKVVVPAMPPSVIGTLTESLSSNLYTTRDTPSTSPPSTSAQQQQQQQQQAATGRTPLYGRESITEPPSPSDMSNQRFWDARGVDLRHR